MRQTPFTITSIRRYLSRAILLILIISSIISIAASYILFRNEMRKVYDTQLATISGIVTGMLSNATNENQLEGIARDLTEQTLETHFYPFRQKEPRTIDNKHVKNLFPDEDYPASAFALGIWSRNGEPRVVSRAWTPEGHLPLSAPRHGGFSWITYNNTTWRVYSRLDHDSQTWITIGLRRSVLLTISRYTVLTSWSADALSVILAGILIFIVIKRGLRPLNRLSKQLSHRHEQDLSPLRGPVPEELQGLQSSLNAFMGRLDEALERERRFTADAAHELRTPLAALKIHLENIRHGNSEESQQSLEKARQGIERLQRVIAQLLTLARVDRHAPAPRALIDLYPIAAQLAGEMLPIAEKQHQCLSISGLSQLKIYADATEVGVLLRNLIDNALRYTPEGGDVEIHLGKDADNAPMLSVLDNGSGIAPELLSKVTERFRRGNNAQRASGSGLGLSIVVGLLQHQSARLSLANRQGGGLEARITWDVAAQNASAQQHALMEKKEGK